MMQKIQFVLRDWTRRETEAISKDPLAKTSSASFISVVNGLLQVPEGKYPNQSQLDFVFDQRTGLITLGEPRSIEYEYVFDAHDKQFSELHNLMVKKIWRGPGKQIAIPDGTYAGQIVLEKCALPSPAGSVTFLAFGIVSSDRKLPQDLKVNGVCRTGSQFNGASEVYTKTYRGYSAGHPFQQAEWGWGKEPVAFLSTLPLQTQALMDRVNTLRYKEDKTSEEKHEMDSLIESSQGIFSKEGRDPDSDRYIKLLVVLHLADLRPISTPRTQEELDLRNRVTDSIVSNMLSSLDDESLIQKIKQDIELPELIGEAPETSCPTP